MGQDGFIGSWSHMRVEWGPIMDGGGQGPIIGLDVNEAQSLIHICLRTTLSFNTQQSEMNAKIISIKFDFRIVIKLLNMFILLIEIIHCNSSREHLLMKFFVGPIRNFLLEKSVLD